MALHSGVMRWLLTASAVGVAAAMQPTAQMRLLVGNFNGAARNLVPPRVEVEDGGTAASFLETAENIRSEAGDLAALPQTFAVVQKAARSQGQNMQQDEALVGSGISMASESVELKGVLDGSTEDSAASLLPSEQEIRGAMAAVLRMAAIIAVFCFVLAIIVHFGVPHGAKRPLYDSCDGSPQSLPLQPLTSVEVFDSDGNPINVARSGESEDGAPERIDIPNFSGNWRLKCIDGNMDAFMTEMGVGWFARIVNKSMRSGVEKQTQHIVQVGNAFQITTVDLWGRRLSQKFLVDGGEQLSSDVEDNTIIIDPRWEGQSLIVKHRTNLGEAIQLQKRMLVDEAMTLEIVAPQGTTVRRIFHRI